MSLVTVNGAPCQSATLRIPRLGVWYADLVVDTATTITGPATISVCDGALELKGRATRTGVVSDSAVLRVLGGAGGLATAAPAKFYRRCPAKVPLQDVLQAAGEKLSPGRPEPAQPAARRVDAARTEGRGGASGARGGVGRGVASAARRHGLARPGDLAGGRHPERRPALGGPSHTAQLASSLPSPGDDVVYNVDGLRFDGIVLDVDPDNAIALVERTLDGRTAWHPLASLKCV